MGTNGWRDRQTNGWADWWTVRPTCLNWLYRRTQIIRCAASKKGNTPAPPTAQTPGPIWLIFCLKVPCGYTFGIAVGIFPFPPRGWDMWGNVVTWAPPPETPKLVFDICIFCYGYGIWMVRCLNVMKICFLTLFFFILDKNTAFKVNIVVDKAREYHLSVTLKALFSCKIREKRVKTDWKIWENSLCRCDSATIFHPREFFFSFQVIKHSKSTPCKQLLEVLPRKPAKEGEKRAKEVIKLRFFMKKMWQTVRGWVFISSFLKIKSRYENSPASLSLQQHHRDLSWFLSSL